MVVEPQIFLHCYVIIWTTAKTLKNDLRYLTSAHTHTLTNCPLNTICGVIYWEHSMLRIYGRMSKNILWLCSGERAIGSLEPTPCSYLNVIMKKRTRFCSTLLSPKYKKYPYLAAIYCIYLAHEGIRSFLT